MKKIAVLALTLAAAGASAPAFAFDDTGFFIRGEAGNTQFDLDADGASAGTDDTSFGLRGGYYFSPYIAVEGFYTRYGQDKNDGVEVTIDGYGAGLVGKYQFSGDGMGLYINGRAGIAQVKAKLSADGFGSDDDADTVPYAGVGAGYDFTPEFGIGLNYDYVKAEYGDSTLDVAAKTLALSVEYRF